MHVKACELNIIQCIGNVLLRNVCKHFTLYLVVVPSIAISVYVCLSFRSNISINFTKFFLHFNCGRYVALFWRQCIMSCTSGFVDDIMFAHNGANGAESNTTLCFVEFVRWRYRGRSLISSIALFICHILTLFNVFMFILTFSIHIECTVCSNVIERCRQWGRLIIIVQSLFLASLPASTFWPRLLRL